MGRLLFLCVSLAAAASGQTITIRAGTVLNGKGGIQKNVRLTIQGGKFRGSRLAEPALSTTT
jgi:adhesin HecA-like repeat protein